MTTHQEDFQRMCITGWIIGYTGARNWVECGMLEGETVGYFSQLLEGGYGCDLNQDALLIAEKRYPNLRVVCVDARTYLEGLHNKIGSSAIFYLDCTWGPSNPGAECMEIIKRRWPQAVVFVNNVDLPGHWLGTHLTQVDSLRKWGRVIIPTYCTHAPVAGYGIVVPDDHGYHPLPAHFTHWKILDHTP